MSTSQVVILAAGKSSRFYPFSERHHKCEITLLGKPLIAWTIASLQKLDLSEIIVVISGDNTTLPLILAKVTSAIPIKIIRQESSRGMADAILSAREHLHEQFFVISPYQLNAAETLTELEKHNLTDVTLSCKPTDTPQHYGIVEIKDDKALSLIEKPQHPVTNPHRVVGIYHFTKPFIDYVATQPMDEYLLESALNTWMQSHEVKAYPLTAPTLSLKYPWDLFDMKNYLLSQIIPTTSEKATVAPTALIKDKVVIEEGAFIGDYAIIEGPAYIGKNAVVGQHCIVRKGSVLEAGAQVQRFCDLANTILWEDVHVHSGFIGDSLIDRDCRIGAGFTTANRRFDRKDIAVEIKGEKISSHLTSLGVLIGPGTKIGIQVGTMPGVVIGSNCTIGPGVMVKKNLPSDSSLFV